MSDRTQLTRDATSNHSNEIENTCRRTHVVHIHFFVESDHDIVRAYQRRTAAAQYGTDFNTALVFSELAADVHCRRTDQESMIRPFESDYFYSSEIASIGQASTHEPQSIQRSGSITYLPSPSEIAPTGQSLSQDPQLIHSSLITCGILSLLQNVDECADHRSAHLFMLIYTIIILYTNLS